MPGTTLCAIATIVTRKRAYDVEIQCNFASQQAGLRIPAVTLILINVDKGCLPSVTYARQIADPHVLCQLEAFRPQCRDQCTILSVLGLRLSTTAPHLAMRLAYTYTYVGPWTWPIQPTHKHSLCEPSVRHQRRHADSAAPPTPALHTCRHG